MLKVIKLPSGKFGIKEVSDNGDSLGMKPESFDSEHEALEFCKGQDTKPTDNKMEDEEKDEVEEDETPDTDEEETDEVDSEEVA